MIPEAQGDPSQDNSALDVFARMPELPSSSERWTVRRKAAVIDAVRRGLVTIDKACQLYELSLDEFVSWERDLNRNGVPGLRATRYQIYRDTEARRG